MSGCAPLTCSLVLATLRNLAISLIRFLYGSTALIATNRAMAIRP